MSRIFRVIFITLAVALGTAAVQAQTNTAQTTTTQTKPAVTSLGPDFPKSEIFIGNSFYYYNNGLPGHVSLLERSAPIPSTSRTTSSSIRPARCSMPPS
jgi:hypothetical protein